MFESYKAHTCTVLQLAESFVLQQLARVLPLDFKRLIGLRYTYWFRRILCCIFSALF